MVTMNGEECHNEWEITFEEIHRNGAMVLALRNFEQYTGDNSYLRSEGVAVAVWFRANACIGGPQKGLRHVGCHRSQ